MAKEYNLISRPRAAAAAIEGDLKRGSEILRPNQLPVYLAIRDFLNSGGTSGYVALPTGAGKTVIFGQMIDTLATELDYHTLVVTSRSLLATQSVDSFNKFTRNIQAGQITAETSKSQRKKELEKKTRVITYNGLIRLLQSGEVDPAEVDLLVLDEAHRALGPGAREAIEKFDRSIKIGFTATPEFNPSKSLKGMLGNEIYSLSIAEAVKQNMLSSFSAIIAETEVDLSDVTINNKGEYIEKELLQAVNIAARNKAVVDLYESTFPSEPAIAYCVGISHAEALAKEFNERNIRAMAVSSKTSPKRLKEIFEMRKRREIDVLCNADLLIEGHDEPWVTVCLNARPTRSRLLAEQRAGRVLRIDEENPLKHAFVVDFIDRSKGARPPVLYAEIAEGAAFLQGVGDVRNITNITDRGRIKEQEEKIPPIIKGLKVIVTHEEVLRYTNDKLSQEYTSAPEGYVTLNALSALFDLPSYRIQKLIQACGITTSGVYLDGRSKIPRLHYSPDALKILSEAKANMPYPPSGWIDAKTLMEALGLKKPGSALSLMNRFREQHPDLAGIYLGGHGNEALFVDPSVLETQIVRKNLAAAPDDVVSRNQVTSGIAFPDRRTPQGKAFRQWFDEQRKLHPEAFRFYLINNRPVLCMERKLAETYFAVSSEGFTQINVLALTLGISRETIKTHALRLGGKEGIINMKSPKNNQMALFVSDELADKLSKMFSKG